MGKSKKIKIELSKEEALVLYDWLSTFNDGNNQTLLNDQSEERVLFDLESLLETHLVEPLKSNYTELVEEARSKIRGQG